MIIMSRKENNRKKISLETFKRLPWWTWIFIVLCVGLPISTLGGALPVIFAIFGIVMCVRVADSNRHILWKKILFCIVLTVLSWGLGWGCVWALNMVALNM